MVKYEYVNGIRYEVLTAADMRKRKKNQKITRFFE
ncbi:uncharacterized protein METZ01_LOCUS186504 [marine metagenome]|uniref:Uncharacterized protein n=1 Tax=marine metagenome TaxID=408172 RepID=A0A382D5E2_9ZZZZ